MAGGASTGTLTGPRPLPLNPAGLTPGYFAVVMATGILSVGTELEGFDLLSEVLLGVCALSFVVLGALTAWRFVAYLSAVEDDFTDPRRAFGVFTFATRSVLSTS